MSTEAGQVQTHRLKRHEDIYIPIPIIHKGSDPRVADKLSHMRYVSATDAKQRLAAIPDAAQREPVTIKRQNREVAVVISPEDYRRLTSANIEAFQCFCDRVSRRAAEAGMTEKKLERLLGDA